MLVFGRDDHQSEVLGSAAKKLGWSVTYARGMETALESFHTRGHDIVVIDHRGSRGIDPDSLCRSVTSNYIEIRNESNEKKSPFIVYTKLFYFPIDRSKVRE